DLRAEPLALDFREWRFRLALGVHVRSVCWPRKTLSHSLDISTETLETLVRKTPINVTHRDDIFRCEIHEIGAALPAHSEGRDVQAVAWGREASAQNVSRHDRQTGARDDCVLDKFPSGFVHDVSPRVRKYT